MQRELQADPGRLWKL